MRKKVSIVGAGNVGSTAAHWIMAKELADVVLVDVVEGVPQGKALDLSQAQPIERSDVHIQGSNDYAATADSDIVIITAGLPRKPGMSRDDLLHTNYKIMKDVVAKVIAYSPESILIVVSNPLDAMAQAAYKQLGLQPPARDRHGRRARCRPLQELCRAGAERQRAEHDRPSCWAAMATPWCRCRASARSAGIPVTELIAPERLAEIVQRTRDGGAEIVKHLKTGSAYYAPSAAAVEMAESILKDKKKTPALRSLSRRRVRHLRLLRRRALQAGRGRHRADHRSQAHGGGTRRAQEERCRRQGTLRRDRRVEAAESACKTRRPWDR